MRLALVALVVAYVMSQFYRAFLAVLTPVLASDVGATAADLSLASGLWFVAFAGMQIPVGWALDTIGPRRTVTWLFTFGAAGGALVFAFATAPVHILIAMVLLGIGCSPVLMGSFFICARVFPPAVFATLAGSIVGIGTIGNIGGSVPLAWAVEAFGWRETIGGVAALTLAIAALLAVFVQDPPAPEPSAAQGGSLFGLLKMPAIWVILVMALVNYAPAAGIRGLWIGPYMTDVFGADTAGIGWASLAMGLAMILGNFAYGPADRIFGSRKWVVIVGNASAAVACLVLFAMPATSLTLSIALMALIGFAGASFPMIVAHGRSFFPPHMTGRGVTLINLFAIGGVGVFQVLTGGLHSAVSAGSTAATAPYAAIFLAFGLALAVGCVFYVFSQDRLD